MNLWYTLMVTGLAFFLDNIVSLISERSKTLATLTAKQRNISNIIRALSGLLIMGFAWLTIGNGWSQSGLKITFSSIPEGMAYAFAVAGFFRILSGLLIGLGFYIFGFKTSISQEFNKSCLGAYMFCLGGLAIVWIDRNTSPVLTPTLIFTIILFFFIGIHYFSTHPPKSKPPVSKR